MTDHPMLRTHEHSLARGAAAAHLIVFIIAIRYQLPAAIPAGYLLAGVLLPVTAISLTRYRGAVTVAVLATISSVSGLLLAMTTAKHGVNWTTAASQSARVLGIALVLAALLWARGRIGLYPLMLTFGLGSLASLLWTGVNPDNPWKYSLSVPVTLVLLSLPLVRTSRWLQVAVALTLTAASALYDSRSVAGLLLVAAALTVTQRTPDEGATTPTWRSWMAIARLALIGGGTYLLVQAAILEGILGETAQKRTVEQIAQSGSVLVGGRPEMGAAFALISDRPGGYGVGTLPGYADIMVAKSGMEALGYNPNNGYVENYMFGAGFEVHSLLGDLWILFGFAGAALALAMISSAIFGLGSSLSRGAATAAGTFLIVHLAWDFTFSPFLSAMPFLPLALAVALPSRPERRKVSTAAAEVSPNSLHGPRRIGSA